MQENIKEAMQGSVKGEILTCQSCLIVKSCQHSGPFLRGVVPGHKSQILDFKFHFPSYFGPG